VTERGVLDALAGQPGGPQLLALGRDRDDLALVGGAVRDLMLGRPPRELDVVVAGDAEPLARELATILGANVTLHGRFGTAAVEWEAGRIDLAQRRAESYPQPGALPRVRPGSAAEDLQRRDFTVNAIAVSVGGSRRGLRETAEHALEDLRAGVLRVMHERSFSDDPTRLLRLARYSARLGFRAEPHTARLAAQALATDALATVSGARVGAELRLALGEDDAVGALSGLGRLGVLSALRDGLSFDAELARRALALLPADGRAGELVLACMLLALAEGVEHDPRAAMFELLDGLEFPAAERGRAIEAALHARALAGALSAASRPSQLHRALSARTPEAVALAGALDGDGAPGAGAVAQAARDWLQRLRHVRLAIDGQDLLAAGVPAGPGIGRRLQATLERRLDGELGVGRDAELDAALDPALEARR
jgi:tRNA nucleotidyltransferase (CCA-adding enzyme)